MEASQPDRRVTPSSRQRFPSVEPLPSFFDSAAALRSTSAFAHRRCAAGTEPQDSNAPGGVQGEGRAVAPLEGRARRAGAALNSPRICD
eukprot:2931265-Pleurochrysis_carterae.AAC.1